jgi:histidinol-phosphate aminotransferase
LPLSGQPALTIWHRGASLRTNCRKNAGSSSLLFCHIFLAIRLLQLAASACRFSEQRVLISSSAKKRPMSAPAIKSPRKRLRRTAPPSFAALANEHLRRFATFQPAKPFHAVAAELGISTQNLARLAANENPLGPSPRAVAAMKAAAEQAHRYPDSGAFQLREALAKKFALNPDEIFIGNGTNEILDLLCRIFLGPGRRAIVGKNSFAVYRIVAHQSGGRAFDVPFKNFTHDLEATLRAVNRRTRLIFLDNPCNPTGTRVSNAALDRFIRRLPPHVVLVLDEAYHEFLDDPYDSLQWIRRGGSETPTLNAPSPKVVVLRSFSKACGLSGARAGYAIAPRRCIELLNNVRQPYNVSAIAQAGALAALADEQHLRRTRETVARGRAWLQTQLKLLGVEFVPSCTNFVLVRVGDSAAIARRLLQLGVIVFPAITFNLPHWIRVSVGTPEENIKFIRALESVLK